MAQAVQDSVKEMDWHSYAKNGFILMGISVLLLLWLILVYANKPAKEGGKTWFSFKALIARLSAAAPMEKEKDILMADDFDGIRELNNKVPPWFNILFYGTIVFAAIYMLEFHVFSSNKLQVDEYTQEMQEADLQKEILLRSGKLVTEANVTLLKDQGSLQSGKDIFYTKCSVCHGRLGEGLVGPNLTDDYWINGAGIKNIFRVIKYGVPAKGMITWQNQLSPRQIQEVASYVYSLHGTNPPNAKPPQGVLAVDTVAVAK